MQVEVGQGVSVTTEDSTRSVEVEVGDGVVVHTEEDDVEIGISEGVEIEVGGAEIRTGPGGVEIEAGNAQIDIEPGSVVVEEETEVRVQPGSSVVVEVDDRVEVHTGRGLEVNVPGLDLEVSGDVTGGLPIPGGVDVQGALEGIEVGIPSGAIAEVEGALAAIELPEITLPGAKVYKRGKRRVYALSGDVLFDFDKDNLRPDAIATLKQVSRSLEKRHPGAVLRVEGHTDSKGNDSYNQKLSERRAASVKKWLAQNSAFGGKQISTVGYGETRPLVANTLPNGKDSPKGRQQNRRVEISVPWE